MLCYYAACTNVNHFPLLLSPPGVNGDEASDVSSTLYLTDDSDTVAQPKGENESESDTFYTHFLMLAGGEGLPEESLRSIFVDAGGDIDKALNAVEEAKNVHLERDVGFLAFRKSISGYVNDRMLKTLYTEANGDAGAAMVAFFDTLEKYKNQAGAGGREEINRHLRSVLKSKQHASALSKAKSKSPSAQLQQVRLKCH